jgi:hypothetical protein
VRSSKPGSEHSFVHALILILSVVLSAGAEGVMNAAGRRSAALSRPGNATVAVAFTLADWPHFDQSAVTVIIVNPGPVPVLAGLSLHRKWLPGGRARTKIVRSTTRPRYLPSRQAAVAAIPEGTIGGLSISVPGGGRRFRLVVMIGQSDRQLLVASAPVTIARPGWTRARRLEQLMR